MALDDQDTGTCITIAAIFLAIPFTLVESSLAKVKTIAGNTYKGLNTYFTTPNNDSSLLNPQYTNNFNITVTNDDDWEILTTGSLTNT